MLSLETIEFTKNTISYEDINSLLTSLWDSLQEEGCSISNIKKGYSVATECLENILKHSKGSETIENAVSILMTVNSDNMLLQTSNILHKKDRRELQEKVDFLNSLNEVGLKKLYQYEIKRRKISSKGGAGLGLIIIAKKTNEKLNVKFDSVSDEFVRVTFSFNVKLG